MIFPEIKRFMYTKKVLDEVICQIRFPPILSIEKEIPYEFQDAIRSIYPGFVDESEIQIPIANENFENVPKEFLELAKNTIRRRNYAFFTEEKQWKINLTRDFISISTLNYSHWEEFVPMFEPALSCFVDIYKPFVYSRIGLRYRDIIRRSNLNLQETDWSELINPAIIGLIGNKEYENRVEEFMSATVLDIKEINSNVRIQTAIMKINNENAFVIDSDFFTKVNTIPEKAIEKLTAFHECATPLIYWCFTEKLHNALEPKPL